MVLLLVVVVDVVLVLVLVVVAAAAVLLQQREGMSQRHREKDGESYWSTPLVHQQGALRPNIR